MAKILNIESLTITVPLGGTITRNSFPSVLWVNYDSAPFFGYINFPQPLEEHLFLVNMQGTFYKYVSSVKQSPIGSGRTLEQAIQQFYGTSDSASVLEILDYLRKANSALNLQLATSGNVVTTTLSFPNCGELNIPGIGTGLVPLQFNAAGECTNLPTTKQQEILIKGAIRNIVTSASDPSFDSYGEPVVFYISILVGGIDYNPASRFPNDIDPLDHDIKEPVTSADIPAVDAYQYLISLQTRGPAEIAQLESLKRSLSKKMIMARDINWLRNCLLAVENAYAALVAQSEFITNQVTNIKSWIREHGWKVFQNQQDILDLRYNLEANWSMTAQGLIAMREEVHYRVYHALKHYGASNSAQYWFQIPVFGGKGSTWKPNTTFKFGNERKSLSSYIVPFSDPPEVAYTTTQDMSFDSGFEVFGYGGSLVGDWTKDTASWATGSMSGQDYFNINEYFHNLIIKSSHPDAGNKMVAITNDRIILSAGTTNPKDDNSKSIEIINGSSTDARILLGRTKGIPNSEFSSKGEEQYVLLGDGTDSKLFFKHFNTGNTRGGYIGLFKTDGNSAVDSKTGAISGSYVSFDDYSEGMNDMRRVNIGGKQIVFRDDNGNHAWNFYWGFSSETKENVQVISMGGGGSTGGNNFFIGKSGSFVCIQHEGSRAASETPDGDGKSIKSNYSGLMFKSGENTPDAGLTLKGLSINTLNDITKYVKSAMEGGDDSSSESKEEGEEFKGGPVKEPLVLVFEEKIPRDFRVNNTSKAIGPLILK